MFSKNMSNLGDLMNTFQTEQENFWAGNFGNEYTTRNENQTILSSNLALFSKVLASAPSVHSVMEFGANIGLNLKAIKQLLPSAEYAALEINEHAVHALSLIDDLTVYHKSIFDFSPDKRFDFVLVKGVLIHLNPDKLKQAYQTLYDSSERYICIAEYYNPSPVQVAYRGHTERLFKRDFAGEMLDMFRNLRLVDYGFVYHRDNNFAQDDITWFLLKK